MRASWQSLHGAVGFVQQQCMPLTCTSFCLLRNLSSRVNCMGGWARGAAFAAVDRPAAAVHAAAVGDGVQSGALAGKGCLLVLLLAALLRRRRAAAPTAPTAAAVASRPRWWVGEEDALRVPRWLLVLMGSMCAGHWCPLMLPCSDQSERGEGGGAERVRAVWLLLFHWRVLSRGFHSLWDGCMNARFRSAAVRVCLELRL